MNTSPENGPVGKGLKDGSGLISVCAAIIGIGCSIYTAYTKTTHGYYTDLFPAPMIAETLCLFGGGISFLQGEIRNGFIGTTGLLGTIFLQEWVKRL